MARLILMSLAGVIFIGLFANIGISEDATVGLWHFDENSGAMAADTSDNNNNGTVNGPIWVKGKFGSALQFDGVDDRVEVPQSESLNFVTQNPFTVLAWINTTSDTRQGIVSKQMQWTFDIDPSNKIVYFPIWGIDDWGFRFTIETNKWYYMAAVWDGDQRIVYVDSVLAGQTPTLVFQPATTNDMWIGALSNIGRWFKGTIDEVQILKKALTEEEVREAENPPQNAAAETLSKLAITWGSIKVNVSSM